MGALGATTAALGAVIFGAGALVTVFSGAVVLAATLGAILDAILDAILGATFEAGAFDPVAFATVFAVLSDIALLLFFEDFVAAALLAPFTGALARPLVALRLAAAAFFEVFETLFLRVFCDTACARNCHAPVRCFYGNPPGAKDTLGRVRSV